MEEIGRILPLAFRQEVHRGGRLVEILAPLWPHIAGKPMARHSRPVAFCNGVLTLESDCPSWSAQLGLMAEEIRSEINRYLGQKVVRRLEVRHVESAPPPPGPAVSDAEEVN